MRNVIRGIVCILLFLPLVMATPLYEANEITTELSVSGGFDLIQEKASGSLKSAEASLFLFPQETARQKINSLDTNGKVNNGILEFKWNDGKIEKKTFGYTATLLTSNQVNLVTKEIPYPLKDSDIAGKEQYLQATKTIDSNTKAIVDKALHLAGNEDDLFKVVFNIATWVEGNVQYDLNTLTEKASQKASWVLENKQGVCDEMTSLFIAMTRSLGLPSRFVSGISYTTSDLFGDPWQAHGWAEVFFPGVGWVPFDITFGEYGYVDPTHIKFRDGFDPAEAATEYNWLAQDVVLKPKDLDFSAKIINSKGKAAKDLILRMDLLSEDIDVNSFNQVRVAIENTADHYNAITLQLAVPKEVSIDGRNKRTILLRPKETKETAWNLQIGGLAQDYWYNFPIVAYSEKNQTVSSSFSAKQGGLSYSSKDIDKITVKDEEKRYSSQLSFLCSHKKEVSLNEEVKATCTLQNNAPVELVDLSFCVGGVCEKSDIKPSETIQNTVTLKTNRAGWQNFVVMAQHKDAEKRQAEQYLVKDIANVTITPVFPAHMTLQENIEVELLVNKNSFSTPENVIITLKGPGFENTWTIDKLDKEERLLLNLQNYKVASSNKFTITTTWKHEFNSFSQTKEVSIEGQHSSFLEKIKLFFNGLIHLFTI